MCWHCIYKIYDTDKHYLIHHLLFLGMLALNSFLLLCMILMSHHQQNKIPIHQIHHHKFLIKPIITIKMLITNLILQITEIILQRLPNCFFWIPRLLIDWLLVKMDACVTCNRSLSRLRRHILSQRFLNLDEISWSI